MNHDLRCPQCQRSVGHAAEEGGVLLLNRKRHVILTKGGGLLVTCPKCGASVEAAVILKAGDPHVTLKLRAN